MKAVFVGGGSLRILPIIRKAMAEKKTFDAGEICLVDLNLPRAETVGRMVMKTPEYRPIDCKVTWTDKLEQALPGADVVHTCFQVVPRKTELHAQEICAAHGFPGGDQLSLNGAFRAVNGGIMIWDIVRKMEKHCPDAWHTNWANPVPIYSGLVNNHTRIKSLGLCNCCYHHRWDLTRLLFNKAEPRDDYKIVTVGINHMDLLLRGEYKGQDIYKLVDQVFNDKNWKPVRIPGDPYLEKCVHIMFSVFKETRRRFGYIGATGEHEGLYHYGLFDRFIPEQYKPRSSAEINRQARRFTEDLRQKDLELRSCLDRELDSKFWAQSEIENPLCGVMSSSTAAAILTGLGSGKPQWLAASLPNRGVVRGFKDRTVLDYSFMFDRQGVHPDPDLEVPDCFHGIINALATHQTMVGDAIAARDPKLFAEALYAYPIRQNSKQSKALWKALLRIYAGVIPREFQKARDYF